MPKVNGKDVFLRIIPLEDPYYIQEFCRVLEIVCKKHNIAPGQLLQGGTRKDHLRVTARDDLVETLRNHPTLTFSYPVLGRYLGMTHSALVRARTRREKNHAI